MDKHPLTRRIGRFRIPERMMSLHPDDVMKVMAECAFVRCEFRFDSMSFEYVAISPHFDEVDFREPAEYGATLYRVNIGNDEYWQRSRKSRVGKCF